MSSHNQIQLKHSSISYVPLGVYEKDFTFFVNDEEIKTSRIISDLLSPKISQSHLIDPTIDTFTIKTKTPGNFTHILSLINFDVFTIPENEINFFIEVFEQLGNDSIKSNTTTQSIDITLDNVISLIQEHEKHDAFYYDQITTEIDFLSKHFYELYEKNEEEIKKFKYSTIEQLVTNENLRIQDEDQLLSFISDLYKTDDRYSTFYEYVLFKNVSVLKIQEFLEIFDITDLTNSIWKSISERLQQEIKSNEASEKEAKRYTGNEQEEAEILFKKETNEDFKGIINYLLNESHNQIENEISFSCSSSPNSSCHPKNFIYHGNASTYYASKNEPNAWVCLEFKNHRIIPTDYTIGSTDNGYYIRSWIIEGSEDNSQWDTIDRQNSCEYMNGMNRIKTFKIQNECKKQYRFIRLRSTSPSWLNYNYLRVNSFELYGNLIPL